VTTRQADRILEVLYDRDGAFVWLDELARAAGVEGAHGLDRALGTLRQRGHGFERSPAHGVRLLRPTVLDAHLIERDLPVDRIGRHVICFGEVGSTNDVAFDSAAGAGAHAVVVTAEAQRAGRGRMGRSWISPPSSGLLASVLLPVSAPSAHDQLTIAAGLAVAEGVEQATGVATALAWPNDVLVDGAKLAGVIVEVRGGRTVIGFGINVTAAPAPEQVGQATACLADAPSACLERIEICRAVLVRLDRWVSSLATDGPEGLHRCWLRRCAMLNRRARFRWAGRTLAGRVLDLSPTESLVVLTDDGQRVHLPAAETTVLRDGEPG